MRIWLNTTSTTQLVADVQQSNDTLSDCECDDCECTDGATPFQQTIPFMFPLSLEAQQVLYNHPFKQTAPLHIQPCDNNRWMVCNPVKGEQVTVVDEDALAFIQQFAEPATLSDISARASMPPHHIAHPLELFSRLGILQDASQPVCIHEQGQAETLTAWLHVTNACNLRCSYCYLHKSTEHMANDTAQRSVDAIFRSALRNGYRRIRLKYAGGEASLRLPDLRAIHDYAAEQACKQGLSFSASMLSNGVALSQRTIDQLKARHIGVMISLDGIGEYHDRQRPFVSGKGSFQYVDRTIALLLESQLRPSINVTVSRWNLEGLVSLIGYILERDLPFTLSYYRDNDCSTHLRGLQFAEQQMIEGMRDVFSYIEKHLPRRSLLNSLIDKASMTTPHQHTCGVGRNYLVIDQHGGVSKCQAAIGQTVTTIDADDPLQVIRHDRSGIQAIPVEQKTGCRDCRWRYWCSGGCPMLTYQLTGRNDIKSPNCHIYQALFPEALRLEALRLLKYETPITLLDPSSARLP